MQNTNKIVLFLVVAALVIAAFVLIQRNQATQDTNIDMEDEITQEQPAVIEENTAVGVTTLFIRNFIDSAPPISSQGDLENAISHLSEEALATLTTTDGQYTSGSLAGFVGVQDVPDVGYRVEEVSSDGITAEVAVILEYSGETTGKLVTLSNVDGVWKIDGIEDYVPVETGEVEEPTVEAEEVEEDIVEEETTEAQ